MRNHRLVDTWTEIHNIIRVVNRHTITTNYSVKAVITKLNKVVDVADDTMIKFLQDQMTMISTSSNKRQYSKASIILAVELLCASPCAYRMIRTSRVICLLKEQFKEHAISCLVVVMRRMFDW